MPWYNCNGWRGVKRQVTYSLHYNQCQETNQQQKQPFLVWTKPDVNLRKYKSNNYRQTSHGLHAMTRTAHHQQPNLAGIYPAVLDVDVGHRLRPVELHQSRVDALVQKLDALTEQPQLLFVQSANNPVTDHHHQVQPSPYTSIIIPHRANQRPFLLSPYTLLIIPHRAIQRPLLRCPSTLLIFTHHPSQGKPKAFSTQSLYFTHLYSSSLTGQTKGLFYSVLILYSSSLTEQFKGLYYAVLLLYSSLLIIPHRANQLAFSTLSFYFTHHPSQGKSTNLFYSVLLLYSSSLRGQINWPFLLCPYTLIIVSHRANQPAFSTLSLPFPTPTIRQCMPLSNSYHQRLHHVCFRFQSFSLCSKYCHLLTTVSKDF